VLHVRGYAVPAAGSAPDGPDQSVLRLVALLGVFLRQIAAGGRPHKVPHHMGHCGDAGHGRGREVEQFEEQCRLALLDGLALWCFPIVVLGSFHHTSPFGPRRSPLAVDGQHRVLGLASDSR